MAPLDDEDGGGEGSFGARLGGADEEGSSGLLPQEPPEVLLGALEEALGADAADAEALLRRLAASASASSSSSASGAGEGRDGATVGRGKAGAAAEAPALETKAFKDCRYISCKSLGLSFRLTPADASGRVDVAFLYNEGSDGFSAYSASPLPAGLLWTDRSRDVVKKLGEPSDKFGGGRLPVGIGYELLGLDVHFHNKSWDDPINPIKFLSVYQHKDPMCGMCTVCGKLARFRCAQCRQQSYCSSACQKSGWSKHKEVCAAFASERLKQPKGPSADVARAELKKEVAAALAASAPQSPAAAPPRSSAAAATPPGPALAAAVAALAPAGKEVAPAMGLDSMD